MKKRITSVMAALVGVVLVGTTAMAAITVDHTYNSGLRVTSTITLTTADIGYDIGNSDKLVIMVVSTMNGKVMNSCKVDGVSATPLQSFSPSYTQAYMLYFDSPPADGTVEVIYSGGSGVITLISLSGTEAGCLQSKTGVLDTSSVTFDSPTQGTSCVAAFGCTYGGSATPSAPLTVVADNIDLGATGNRRYGVGYENGSTTDTYTFSASDYVAAAEFEVIPSPSGTVFMFK